MHSRKTFEVDGILPLGKGDSFDGLNFVYGQESFTVARSTDFTDNTKPRFELELTFEMKGDLNVLR